MSRTKRNSSKFSEALRSVAPYKREQRRKLLKQFEQEYTGNNNNPLIEL